MTSDRIRIASVLMLAALLGALTVSAFAQAPSKAVVSQIATIQQIKQNFTPAQKKMDSALAFASVGQKSPAMVGAFSTAMPRLATTTTGKVVVDVHGTVSSALLQAIKNAGGDVLYSSTRWNSIHAALPLASVESLADRSDVVRINKAPLARTSVGSLTSQGYLAHRAKQVVEQQGISGAGVNVGILSDSALPAQVAALKASGDLPPTAFVLRGQAGPSNGTNEGTAMMEIVYDMAPGSNQIFATAFTSEASFADNIIALQQAGCKVIADDVTYSDEGAFQDTIVAQAVNQVVAAGSSYFSSAGNSGSALNGNSQVWQGDFRNGGPVSGVIGAFEGGQGSFHDFGTGQLFDQYLAPSGVAILQWSDPYGGACNDYDLFVTDSTGTVIKGFSAAVQDCSPGSIPDEESDYANPAPGDRIYVVLFSGAARALFVNGWSGGQLAIATTGNTWGHNAGKNTISMAATYWGSAHKGAIPFTGFANPVEPFSSDGPRKIFYNPNGTEITPGNVLFATNGGTTLQKPDLTAADGVFTKTPGFLPFFGTSASSPHAAGIAALVVQARPGFTPAQVKTAMVKSALDNMAVGFDINGGWGVAMANGAVSYALTH